MSKAIDMLLKLAVYGDTAGTCGRYVYRKLEIASTGEKGTENIVKLGISTMPNNPLIRSGMIKESKEIKFPCFTKNGTVMIDGCSMRDVKKKGGDIPTIDIMSVDVSGLNNQTKGLLAGKPIWFKANKYSPEIIVELFSGHFCNIYTGDVYGIGETGLIPSPSKGWKRYVLLKASPSEVRRDMYLGINTVVGSDSRKYRIDNDRVRVIIKKMTHGASESFREEGKMKLKKFQKGFARLSQWSPYSKDFGQLKSTVILADTFDKAVEPNGKVTTASDGISLMRVGFVQDAIKRITGVQLPAKCLLGRAFQTRPGLIKSMTIVVDDETMMVVRSCHHGYKIIGDKSIIPDFMADVNCNKADIDKSIKSLALDVLAPMVKLGKPKFNPQLVIKLSMAKGFAKIIESAYNNEFERVFSIYKNTNADKNNVSISEVKTGTVGSVLMKIAPDMASSIDAVFRGELLTRIKAFVKGLNKFHLEIKDGANWKRFVGDVGSWFGVRLLQGDEIFVPKYENGKEAEVVRFPSPEHFSHFPCHVVGLNTLIKRVYDNDVLTKARKEIIIRLLSTLDSSLMMAPIDHQFRDLTGGSDVDSDSGNVITDPDIVAALRTVPTMAIDTVKPVRDVNMGVLDENGYIKAFKHAIGVTKVGVACNHLTALYELISCDKKYQINAIRDVFDIKEMGNEPYTRRFVSDMTVKPSDVAAAFKEMAVANLDDDKSRMNVLSDAIVIAKTSIDRVIDAAKTGDEANDCLLPWRKAVKSDVFTTVKIEPSKYEDRNIRLYKDGDFLQEYCGRLSRTRNSLFRKFLQDINTPVFTEEKVADNKMSAILLSVNNRQEKDSFAFLKESYKDEVGMNASLTISSDGEDEYEDFFKLRLHAINNMGRMIAVQNSLNPSQIAKLALYASARTTDTLDSVIRNNFAVACFPEEMKALAANIYCKGLQLSEEVLAIPSEEGRIDAENYSEEINFTKGLGKDKTGNPIFIADKAINGKYTVKGLLTEDGKSKFKIFSNVERELLESNEASMDSSILLRIHRSSLKDKDTIAAAKELLDTAAYGIISCYLLDSKKQRDHVDLFDKNNNRIGSVRLSLYGKDMANILHGKKFAVKDCSYGNVRTKEGRDLYVMSVLADIIK